MSPDRLDEFIADIIGIVVVIVVMLILSAIFHNE